MRLIIVRVYLDKLSAHAYLALLGTERVNWSYYHIEDEDIERLVLPESPGGAECLESGMCVHSVVVKARS